MKVSEIGQLFVVGFEGAELSHNAKSFLAELKPAGVILFSRNIESPLQVAALNRELQLFALDNWKQGLLIGIDQEGGRVRRLLSPFVCCPSARDLGSGPTPCEVVRSYMTVMSCEMRLVGFNTNFVPVLDVVTPSAGHATSVIGDRSFGGSPETVARLGQVVIEAVRSMGIVPCGKHFPGHGGTTVDSHLELPMDKRDRHILWQRDLIPYRRAIENGIDMLMTAHVVYTSLDPFYPSTLSRTMVNQILRSDLGYDGVVITDDLDMGAITSNYDVANAAQAAVEAGVDLLLFSKSDENVLSARDTIVHLLDSGAIPRRVVADALERIKRLKEKYKTYSLPAEADVIQRYFDL